MSIQATRNSLIFSIVSFDHGRDLIHKYGKYAAMRYIKNLGLPLDYALELFAMRCSK